MDTPQTKNRLLLVDGDPKSLRVLDVSLKKAGFDVTTATSGHEAIASLEAELPDLIISDTDLAEMDGFELCNRIKAKSDWAKIPFLFVSGRKSIEDKIRGLELGVDDYLTKPIYIKEIGVRVRTALQRAERERIESRREGRTRFAGELSELGVVDLVQTIEVNRKSGIIHIVNRDDRRGSIFFREGKVIDAEVGRLSGAHALYRLFSWSEGQFAVEFKHIRRHDVIDLSMAALLMEGMRRLDESAHLLEQLPSPNHVLEVDCRVLAEELAELPDEMNSVLRLCDGARTLQEVIEESDHPDLETLAIVSKLYLGQIIFAREAPARGNESHPGVRLANWLSEGGAEPPASSPGPIPRDRSSGMGEVSPDDSVFPPRVHLSSAPDTTVNAEGDLADALPSQVEAGTNSTRPVDTLKGIPVDSTQGDSEALPSSPASPADASATAGAEAYPPPRATSPMGLAERLLSGDSGVRVATMQDVLADGDGRDSEPQPAQHHTNPYGNPVTPSAAALVQDVVSSARTSSSPAPPFSQLERPRKEVDWGAWPAVAGPEPPATEDVAILAGAQGDEGPQGGKSSATPLDATDLAVLELSRASLMPASPENTQAPALEVHSSPQHVASMTSDPATVSHETAAASAEGEAASRPSGTPPPLPRIALVPAPPPPPQSPLGPTTTDGGNRSDSSADTLETRPESSLTGRTWLLLIAAFGLGVVGVFALTRGSSRQEAGTPATSPATATVVTPAKSPPAPPAPTVAVSPVPSAAEAVLSAKPVPTSASSPAPEAKRIERKLSGLAPDTGELRKKCIAANAGGRGRAKAVARACRPVLDADSRDAEVMLILARAEIDRSRFAEARILAKRALAADPQRFEAYVYLGTAEQAAGKLEDARAAYKQYLELAPDGPFARELRAILSNL